MEEWVRPVVFAAAGCEHVAGARHRFVALELEPLVGELSAYAGSAAVPLGGIRVGSFGIVLQGFAATDWRVVERNIIWEDEHCLECCGVMLRMIEPIHHKVLMRCGPTIGAREGVNGPGGVVDEYWTD